jgi:hypothetical protein
MLIAPVLLGMTFGHAPRCEVCRIGPVCAACIHQWGSFLLCSLCATNIATAVVVRIAFAPHTERAESWEPPIA